MKEPSIEQYLIANCLFTIDEFNILYKDYDKKQLKNIADENYNEMDITVRIGYPFKQNAHYTVGENSKMKKEQKINHDLYIVSHNFKIEVKYLKNWKSSSNTRSSAKNWNVFQQDFDWLLDEIDANGHGKVAFVIGWFNCVESFSQLIQLGKGKGAYPLADEKKLSYFPFLTRDNEPTIAKELEYNYISAYKKQTLNLISKRKGEYNCMFLGNENDTFHFAIYY